MRFLTLLFCFSLSFFSAQELRINDAELLKSITFLDQSMRDNKDNIIEVLDQNVSFGHSNGWIQNYNDFIKNFKSNKVKYESINQTQLKEFKKAKNAASVRRIVHVKGWYKGEVFEMDLSLLEIWIKKNQHWKLWSRQSIELKP